MNPGNNSLVITDYADNLRRLARIIAALDLPNATDLEVIPLKHAVASDLVVLVQRLVEQGPTGLPGQPQVPQAPGAPGAGSGNILADVRTNSLLIRAANPARLSMVRSLVQKLDLPGQGGAGGSNINVVYLKNADATRLAQVLRAAYAAEARPGGQGGPGGGLGGLQAGGQQGGAQGQPPGASLQQAGLGGISGTSGGMGGMASQQAAAPLTGAAQPSTGGFIQADPATNSLIITAPEPLYRQLRAVIDQLDSRRAQVYVETHDHRGQRQQGGRHRLPVAGCDRQGRRQVRPDRRHQLRHRRQQHHQPHGRQGYRRYHRAAHRGPQHRPVEDFFGTVSLAALARFLETNADGNILSTPNLVTLDNEEARITIGQNVPFVTGSFTSAAQGATNPFQTIERQDVGITLRVRPQIGERGTVRMQVYQEVSSVVNQAVSTGVADATAGLVTNKRAVESNVVVDDGQVIVLGGLMQDQFSNNRDKIPLLGDAPLIGPFFRSENRSRVKTNLMVFLRPVVMRDQEAASRLSLDRYDLIRAQQQALQPEQRFVMPINEAPMLPPLRGPQVPDSATPPTPPAPLPVPVIPAAPHQACLPLRRIRGPRPRRRRRPRQLSLEETAMGCTPSPSLCLRQGEQHPARG